MNPLVSLVVLGFRDFLRTTGPCLDSLLPWIHDPEVEILAVDNGSPDDSAQKTQSWCLNHPHVRCLISDSNRGYAGGMNWGASHATGDWLLLVNNDTLFPEHAIDSLKRVIKQAPSNVAMLAPVTNAAGNGQRLLKPDTSLEDWLTIGAWLNRHPTGQLLSTYRCDFFCVAIRRDVWLELNGLDTAFGLGYYEDFDFSLRLREAGWEQKITEDVFVAHLGSASFNGSREALNLLKKNKKIIQSKHPGAKFQHARVGNYSIIEEYIAFKRNGNWSASLQARADLRIPSLILDRPRSILKRWLWSRKVNNLIHQFRSAFHD